MGERYPSMRTLMLACLLEVVGATCWLQRYHLYPPSASERFTTSLAIPAQSTVVGDKCAVEVLKRRVGESPWREAARK